MVVQDADESHGIPSRKKITNKKHIQAHLANGPWKKSLNFIFPTKNVIPKSSKPVSHSLSKTSLIRPAISWGKRSFGGGENR